MSEPVIIIEPQKNWTYAEKGRRPQHKNKEEGGEESREEGGREGGGEGARRAEIAEITVAEGHGRSGEGSKRRRGSIRREENYRREESEELEGGRAEKEVGKNKIAEIAEIAEITVAKGHGRHGRLRKGSTEIRGSLRREESEELEERRTEKEVGKNKIAKITKIAEITLTKGHGRHRQLREGNKGVKGSVRREEYDRREESEELEERRIEKEVSKKRKRIIEIIDIDYYGYRICRNALWEKKGKCYWKEDNRDGDIILTRFSDKNMENSLIDLSEYYDSEYSETEFESSDSGIDKAGQKFSR
ncbi:hypothetical protein Glove_21g21 [Diversispora epigaea]|uniref:Uncharacterized protein n=1 Tax=Diversispora epigaea TaxID=1348612 RepID=A0A397JLK4_9GLOM|nr:hypothetical protein Glove_21g21 [Diversispora epigaea]